MRQEKGAFEVHIHHLVKLLLGGVGKGRIHTGARVVDQKVELLGLEGVVQGRFHLRQKGVETFAIRHIERQGRRLAAEGLDFGHHGFGFGFFGVVREEHIDAFVGQAQGHVFAEAAAAAGNQGDFRRGHGEENEGR